MKPTKFITPFLGLVLLFLAACGTGETAPAMTPTTDSLPPSPYPTHIVEPTLTSEPTPLPPEHRIGVRVVEGVGEFYDRSSGEVFIPRGSNYIRLGEQQDFAGSTFTYHSTFNVGLYDPTRAQTALERMHVEGYNVVRGFVNGNCKDSCIGDPEGSLSAAYIANMMDFLQKAKTNDIYVILTTDAEPGNPYYLGLLDSTWSEDFGGANRSYLTGGGVLVGREFWQDLVEALLEQGAPLDAILAYELRNELFFETNAAPLNFPSGTVTAANGKTYDMASAVERQSMMDEGLVYWIDQIRAAILEKDPTALVSVGFFPPDAPNPWQSAPRYIRTDPAVWVSTLDFIDFHPYPGGYKLDKLVENFGMNGHEEKPVIMGEFGAARSTYATVADTARALHDWQVDSCSYGFDGWLLWTWDSQEQVDFYNGLSGAGEIDQALAPANRPDACQPGEFDFFVYNLALGMEVRASRSLPDQPPSGAVDGNANYWWGAGDFAPQWVQIDLGAPQTIGALRLVVSQSPPGDTRHEVWAGAAENQLSLLTTFDGYTTDGQVLEFTLDTPLENIRFIRVKTLQSPSWVAWKEIEALAP